MAAEMAGVSDHTRTMVGAEVVTACIRKVWLAFVKEYASSNLVRPEVRHIPGNGDARCIST